MSVTGCGGCAGTAGVVVCPVHGPNRRVQVYPLGSPQNGPPVYPVPAPSSTAGDPGVPSVQIVGLRQPTTAGAYWRIAGLASELIAELEGSELAPHWPQSLQFLVSDALGRAGAGCVREVEACSRCGDQAGVDYSGGLDGQGRAA